MIKKILVPTDASEPAKRALVTALELAKKFDSQILLLHVVFTPEAVGYTLGNGISVPQEQIGIFGREALRLAMDGIDQGIVPIEKKLIPGHPAAVILNEIKNEKVDLVVMGSRGYGPLAGSLLGSISQRVISKAQCPVMMVN